MVSLPVQAGMSSQSDAPPFQPSPYHHESSRKCLIGTPCALSAAFTAISVSAYEPQTPGVPASARYLVGIGDWPGEQVSLQLQFIWRIPSAAVS